MLFDALTFLYKFPICQTAIERYRAGQGIYDYANKVHDLAVGPADKFQLRLSALVSTLNLVCDAPVRQHHRFPRGEAVERSETDEERRDGTISYAVRKKGTI